MTRVQANKWVDQAVMLMERIGYANIDALDAVGQIINHESGVSEGDPEMTHNWRLVAKVFEGIYRKAVGR